MWYFTFVFYVHFYFRVLSLAIKLIRIIASLLLNGCGKYLTSLLHGHDDWIWQYSAIVSLTFTTVNGFVTRITRRWHMWSINCLPFRSAWSHPEFSGIRVTRSLVLYVVFCRSLFVLFSFDNCIVFPSIYSFWLLHYLIFKLFLAS